MKGSKRSVKKREERRLLEKQGNGWKGIKEKCKKERIKMPVGEIRKSMGRG